MGRLRDAAADGRLSFEELADRVEAAGGAATRAELERLTRDLSADVERTPPATADEQRHVPPMVRRLRERRSQHLQRGRIYRAAFVVAGFVVLAAGVAMLVLPGPAFVVIPIGLAILSLEFAWAERLLEHALEQAADARQKASRATPGQRLLTVVAIACAAAAFVAAALIWDIPYIPV
jgi:uncharacterized protein (TIGR02611 family)